MSADDFTTAREETAEDAADLWAHQQGYAMTGTERGAFEQGYLAGSAWARARLAAQEPTGDEHYAAAQVVYEATTDDDILRWPHVSDEETARCMNLASAALTAAREARP